MGIARYIRDASFWHRKCEQLIDLCASIFGGTSTGAANAYVLDTSLINGVPEPTELVDGAFYRFIPNFSNTGSSTLKVATNIAAKTIKKQDGTTNVATGDIVSGEPVFVQYDLANDVFRLVLNANASTPPAATGIESINALTAADQFLVVDDNGTDFTIDSLVDTHTFNLPIASATNTGKLSSADWSTFDAKEPALTKGNLTATAPLVFSDTRQVIGGATDIEMPAADAVTDGYLTSADWNTFNDKQEAIWQEDSATQISTVTGTINTWQGNSGGLTIVGGTASGDDLTLSSTSNATKGSILFGTSAYDEVENVLGVGVASPSALYKIQTQKTATDTSGIPSALRIDFSANPSGASTAQMLGSDCLAAFDASNANSLTSIIAGRLLALNNNSTAGGSLSTLQGIALQAISGPIIGTSGTAYSANVVGGVFQGVHNSNTATTVASVIGGNFQAANRGSTTVTTVTAGLFGLQQSGATGVVSNMRGVYVTGAGIFGNQLSAGTITNAYFVDIEGFPSGGSTFTNTPHQLRLNAGATACIAIRQLGAANENRFQGNVMIGADSAPANNLHIQSATPIIQLTDTDTNADCQIIASSATGSLILAADINNEVGSSLLYFSIDGSDEYEMGPNSFYPTTTNANSLGTAGNQWSDLFLGEGGVINFDNGDVTITQTGNVLAIAGTTDVTFNANIKPDTTDSGALGGASNQWSDLFLAEGGVINWDNGDVTLTQAGNILTLAGTTRFACNAEIASSGATAGIGYITGAGGAVTQLTSKATGVTIDTCCGQITTHNAALAANTRVFFTVTNSAIASSDVIIVNIDSGGTANAYDCYVSAVGSGSFNICLHNITAGSLSQAVVISFAKINAVTS